MEITRQRGAVGAPFGAASDSERVFCSRHTQTRSLTVAALKGLVSAIAAKACCQCLNRRGSPGDTPPAIHIGFNKPHLSLGVDVVIQRRAPALLQAFREMSWQLNCGYNQTVESYGYRPHGDRSKILRK